MLQDVTAQIEMSNEAHTARQRSVVCTFTYCFSECFLLTIMIIMITG